MKFGKEFITQMVPEWEQAYMNYDYLKSLLKDIQGFKQKRNKAPPKEPTVLPRNHTLYRAFSGLTRSRRRSRSRSMSPPRDLEEQVILVKDSGGGYETEFLMASDEGGEYELVFFRRLDDEFNKVDKFYQKKVEQVLEEATSLNKQMEAFIAFRIRVDDPEGSLDWSVEMTRLRTDLASSSTGDDQMGSSSDAHRNNGAHHMDIIEESDQSHRGNSGAEDTDTEGSKKSRNIKVHRPAPLEVLDRVKIHNTLETPYSTIQGVLKKSNHFRLNFKHKELKRIEEQLKQAFVEFYQKLQLLKNYSFLNLMAFSKIMKKYDKITSRNASRSYLKMVDDSYLGNSEEVNRLMERVEVTFIKHFTNGNRSKGIKNLRPTPKKERHRVTYSFGFFSGCMTALIVALILVIRARNIIEKEGTTQYMETMFPLYSLFGFIVLHMIMYGLDIYFWRRYRVNYSYIFGFKHGSVLGYIPVFLCSVVLGTFALASVLANLDMEMDGRTKDYQAFTELLPLVLVTTVVLVVFCPFNILYRSSRFFLLRTAFHGICAPLYKVTLPDFLLADQLTSQVQAFRSFEFYICYYGWNDYKHRKNTCKDKDIYVTFSFLIASIPFWIRFLQCIRRFVEEKDKMQGYNSLKYFSTIVAVCMRTAYNRNHSLGWKITAWTFSGIAAVVSTYWDLVIDWGLLQRHSKNRWLRDKLLVSHKSVYFAAIVLNVLLRFAWVQTVLDFKVSFLHTEALITIVASLEIIRRGMWTFFRLENEHLNNVEGYRAFKSVPLPFYYDEDDSKYE